MVVSQCLEVPGEGSFSTVKQSIGNILNGKETSLLKGFNTYPLNPMAAESSDPILFPDEKVFFTGIQGEGDGDLFAISQVGARPLIDRDYLEENLPRFKSAACFKIGPINLIDGVQDCFRFKRGTL